MLSKLGLLSVFLLAASSLTTAQASSNHDFFTVSAAGPVVTAELHVEYVLRDDSGLPQVASSLESSVEFGRSSRFVLGTALAGKSAKSIQAIAFLPGCQFETIAADLVTGVRQADFKCQKLPSFPLRGRASVSQFAGKKLAVRVFYNLHWAGKFFGPPWHSVPHLYLLTTSVEADGSFAFVMPDFAADPLWNSLSHDASLTFTLVDTSNGSPLAELSAPRDLSLGSELKVAARYPSEITFAVK
jgi:hypothetical protein